MFIRINFMGTVEIKKKKIFKFLFGPHWCGFVSATGTHALLHNGDQLRGGEAFAPF